MCLSCGGHVVPRDLTVDVDVLSPPSNSSPLSRSPCSPTTQIGRTTLCDMLHPLSAAVYDLSRPRHTPESSNLKY